MSSSAVYANKLLFADSASELRSSKSGAYLPQVLTPLGLDGRASVIFGTHTHIPTADAKVLPGGNADQAYDADDKAVVTHGPD